MEKPLKQLAISACLFDIAIRVQSNGWCNRCLKHDGMLLTSL